MKLADWFIHIPSQDCTNPFALRHLARFSIRLAVVALLAWWGSESISTPLTPPLAPGSGVRVQWEEKARPADDYALILPKPWTSGLPRGQIFSSGGELTGTVFGYSPPSEIFGYPLLANDFAQQEYASPLTLLLTLGSEPFWRLRYKTTIIDPVTKKFENVLLPRDIRAIVDVTADGRYYAGLREMGLIRGELTVHEFLRSSPGYSYGTEVVLIDAATHEWRGTGMPGPHGYFDREGKLVVVGTKSIARYDLEKMEAQRLEMPPWVWLEGSSDDRDDPLVGTTAMVGASDQKHWRSQIHRIGVSPEGKPRLDLIVSMDGWATSKLRKGMARLFPRPVSRQEWVAVDLEERKLLGRDDSVTSQVAPFSKGLWLEYGGGGLIPSDSLPQGTSPLSEGINLEWAP